MRVTLLYYFSHSVIATFYILWLDLTRKFVLKNILIWFDETFYFRIISLLFILANFGNICSSLLNSSVVVKWDIFPILKLCFSLFFKGTPFYLPNILKMMPYLLVGNQKEDRWHSWDRPSNRSSTSWQWRKCQEKCPENLRQDWCLQCRLPSFNFLTMGAIKCYYWPRDCLSW